MHFFICSSFPPLFYAIFFLSIFFIFLPDYLHLIVAPHAAAFPPPGALCRVMCWVLRGPVSRSWLAIQQQLRGGFKPFLFLSAGSEKKKEKKNPDEVDSGGRRLLPAGGRRYHLPPPPTPLPDNRSAGPQGIGNSRSAAGSCFFFVFFQRPAYRAHEAATLTFQGPGSSVKNSHEYKHEIHLFIDETGIF